MTDETTPARKPGTWAKGQSGNPAGKPKVTFTVERDGQMVEMTIAELCREETVASIATIVEIRDDTDNLATIRLAAAEALLNRGHGRPTQAVELTGPNGGPIKTITTDMTAKEAAERYREELG